MIHIFLFLHTLSCCILCLHLHVCFNPLTATSFQEFNYRAIFQIKIRSNYLFGLKMQTICFNKFKIHCNDGMYNYVVDLPNLKRVCVFC